jgi:uncharacterized protein
MGLQEVLRKLQSDAAVIHSMGVKSLSVFGSVARGEARIDSDVDLLVEFALPVGLFAFIRLQRHLEALLGCRVDLVTPDALRPEFRKQIEDEALRAA